MDEYDFTDMQTVDDHLPAVEPAQFKPAEQGRRQKNKQRNNADQKTPNTPRDTVSAKNTEPVSTPALTEEPASGITPMDAVADIMEVLPDYFNNAAHLGKDVAALLPINPWLIAIIVGGAAVLACSLDSRRQA